MNILFDVDSILDLLFVERPAHSTVAMVRARLSEADKTCWAYCGSVQMLHYQAMKELRQIHPEKGEAECARTAREMLAQELGGFEWLASLAGEGAGIFDEDDPAKSQLIKALERLGEEARVLTSNKALLTTSSRAVSPEILENECFPASPIDFIDLKRQQDRIRPDLEKRIHTILHHGRYILGDEVAELEAKLAQYVGVKHCIGVSSGTDSLLIAMMALGIGPGDEVITVPYTWISTAEMIALLGAKPVFVDIDEKTWNLDPTKLADAITPRTKAIMPVGIYGQTADMTTINEIAARCGNLPVIEDAAQSFGATHYGKASCSLSKIGSTSFFPSKPLGGYGDGGALFTDDDDLNEIMRQIRAHGQARKHHHPILGLNGRLDTMQAAIILAKLDIFAEEVAQRQAVAQHYAELLADCEGIALPWVSTGNTSVYAQFTILSEHRDTLVAALKDAGIPAVSYYSVPLHMQPVFANLGYQQGDFPVAERIANHCLSLPMSPGLSESDQKRICQAIQRSTAKLVSADSN